MSIINKSMVNQLVRDTFGSVLKDKENDDCVNFHDQSLGRMSPEKKARKIADRLLNGDWSVSSDIKSKFISIIANLKTIKDQESLKNFEDLTIESVLEGAEYGNEDKKLLGDFLNELKLKTERVYNQAIVGHAGQMKEIEIMQLGSDKKESRTSHPTIDKNLVDQIYSKPEDFKKFYTSFKTYLDSDNSILNDFFKFFTLGIRDENKKLRLQKLNNLKESLEIFDNSKDIQAIFNHDQASINRAKATLQFALALMYMGDKANKDNQRVLDEVKELLHEAKKHSEPARIFSENFNPETIQEEFKKNENPEGVEQKYKEFMQACKAAGVDKILPQDSVHNIFKYRTQTSKAKEIVKDLLKTALIVLSLPIAWTLSILAAVVFVIFALFLGLFIGK